VPGGLLFLFDKSAVTGCKKLPSGKYHAKGEYIPGLRQACWPQPFNPAGFNGFR